MWLGASEGGVDAYAKSRGLGTGPGEQQGYAASFLFHPVISESEEERGDTEKREQRIRGEHEKHGLGNLLHQAARLPIHIHHLQVSGLVQQVQPESRMVMCSTVHLRSVGEWTEVGGEGSGGKTMQNLVDWLRDWVVQRENAQPTAWWLTRSH